MGGYHEIPREYHGLKGPQCLIGPQGLMGPQGMGPLDLRGPQRTWVDEPQDSEMQTDV